MLLGREDGAATCVDYCESEFLFCSLSRPDNLCLNGSSIVM